jgi:AcrR family transcriptional regulator
MGANGLARVPVDERRAQLLAAAMRVVARDGVAAATTRRIAAEAGISLGIVHYAYRSKNELLGDVAVAATQQLVSVALNSIQPGSGVRENLRRMVDAIFGLVEADPDAQLALYELTTFCLRDNELAAVATGQYAGYLTACREVLSALAVAARVEFRADLDVLARLMETVVDGGMLAWLTDRDTANTRAALELFINYLESLTQG